MRRDQIDEARKVLELGVKATIPEIKEAYRRLSLKYHPDKCRGKDRKKCEEMFKKINNANAVLMEYCLSYKFSFKDTETAGGQQKREMEDHMKRFYDGWWSDLDNE